MGEVVNIKTFAKCYHLVAVCQRFHTTHQDMLQRANKGREEDCKPVNMDANNDMFANG